MAKKPDLENYVDVAERLQKFHERYPEGSLQGDYMIETVAEQLMLIYCAKAYRHPADPRPGVGYAWEPIPGLTPYTRGSELMVGETSAWGRALAALGFEVHRGIASKQEVRNREDVGEDGKPLAMSPKQVDFLESLLKKKLSADDTQTVMAWATETLTGGREGTASKAIDAAKTDPAPLLNAAQQWQAGQTDLLADADDLPDPADHDEEPTL